MKEKTQSLSSTIHMPGLNTHILLAATVLDGTERK